MITISGRDTDKMRMCLFYQIVQLPKEQYVMIVVNTQKSGLKCQIRRKVIKGHDNFGK